MSPHVIDLHFGVLQGAGWGQYEVPEQLLTTTVSQAVAAGSLVLPVVEASLFKVDQLICLLGSDDQYYPAVIKRVEGSTITMKSPVPVNVSAGAAVYNFYANDAHPNLYGFHTLADESVRRLTHAEQFVARQLPAQWAPTAGAAVTQDSTFTYNNPGAASGAYAAVLVSCAAANAGAVSPWTKLPGGVYCVEIPVNVGQRVGGYSGGLYVDVQELSVTGEQYVISSQTITGYDGITLVKPLFSVAAGSSVRVNIRNANSGSAYFSLGQLRYFRVTDKIPSLDRGKHLLFGDSWVARDPVMSRLRLRLPNAEVLRSGVPGHSMPNLVARFWTDVAPHKPDFVWVMCGTNDAYAGYPPARFSAEMNIIKRNLMMIGAQPIFWNCSVCSAYFSGAAGEQLTNSRKYAMDVNYHDQM